MTSHTCSRQLYPVVRDLRQGGCSHIPAWCEQAHLVQSARAEPHLPLHGLCRGLEPYTDCGLAPSAGQSGAITQARPQSTSRGQTSANLKSQTALQARPLFCCPCSCLLVVLLLVGAAMVKSYSPVHLWAPTQGPTTGSFHHDSWLPLPCQVPCFTMFHPRVFPLVFVPQLGSSFIHIHGDTGSARSSRAPL